MSRGLRLGFSLCAVLMAIPVLAAPPWAKHEGEGAEPGSPIFSPAAQGATPCLHGFADVYSCNGVDLESFVPLADLGAPLERAAGIWGWTDPESRREYALIALNNRVGVVDITDAKDPHVMGDLLGLAKGAPNREVNVYGNYALIVADGADSNGIQVFDLTQLRNAAAGPPVHFASAGGLVAGTGRVHNIAVNAETGFAYAVGGQCGGGLNMIDLHDLPRLTDVGCWADPARTYIHDTQCVVYRGPDRRFQGHEICFASAVDALLILDVTDKANVQKISRTGYSGVGYTHQAWLTEDHKHLLLDDEFDERSSGGNTRTYLWDVTDLTAPRQFAAYEHSTHAIDHNLYIHGKQAYESNYTSGLRILDVSKVAAGEVREVGFFDIVPDDDSARFDGAWGNYLFPSGTIAVSGIGQGLYILRQTPLSGAGPCKPGPQRLCFQGNRFGVEVGWRDRASGETGVGTVLRRGANFGVFSLGSGEADLLVRLTKTGRELRLLYGQLTNLEFSLGLTDARQRKTTRYTNGPGNCGAVQPIPGAVETSPAGTPGDEGDVDLLGLLNPQVFDSAKPGTGISESLDLSAVRKHGSDETGTCQPGPTRLCLHDKRFQAELTWRDPFSGASGIAKATKITDDSGTFAFKATNGVDVAVKTVESEDRTRIVWGSLTSFEFTLTVTDTLTGETRTYTNPAGTFCGGVDAAGF